MNFTIKNNEQFNSKEIYFTDKPTEETREALKALRFRWHKVKRCWYGFADDAQIAEAIGGAAVLSIPEAEAIEEGGLYDGWRGGNNRKWHTDDELKACLMADFKRAGIKASIRKNRAGYLTSITITITISASDVLSYDEWIAQRFGGLSGYPIRSGWLYYTDESGKLADIFSDNYYSLPADEQTAMLENIARTAHRLGVQYSQESNTEGPHKFDVFNDEAAAKIALVKSIVASYNHDQTNSMIDYFDRDIYDHYCVKLVA